MLLHPSVIERFTAHAPGLTGAARRTLRTNLRFIARAVVPQLDPADAPLPRERAKAPYTAARDRRLPRAGRCAADGGAADARRRAGLPGRRRRADPRRPARRARHRHHLPLRRRPRDSPRPRGRGQCRCWPATTSGCWRRRRSPAAAWSPAAPTPARRNITNPLTRALAGGTGLPRLDTSRLRATWLAEAAQLLGLPTFMHAAGITCSQRLGDIIATLDPGGEATRRGPAGRERPVSIPLAAARGHHRRSGAAAADRGAAARRRASPPADRPHA